MHSRDERRRALRCAVLFPRLTVQRGTLYRTLAYGALAAVVLVCFRLISLAPLAIDWGRELIAGTIALAGVVIGIRLASRNPGNVPPASGGVQRDSVLQAARESPNPAAPGAAVPVPGTAPDPLTPREQRVLALLALGLSNKEIARELSLSENTIKTHLANLYAKLGVKRRTEALLAARALGMIT